MAPMPCPRPGTRRFVYGSWPQATPPELSSATRTTSFLFLSPQTTVRSSRDRVTGPLSYGTPWATVNSPSPKKAIPNGSHVSGSRPILRTLSSSAPVGISLSRWVKYSPPVGDLPRMPCNFYSICYFGVPSDHETNNHLCTEAACDRTL